MEQKTYFPSNSSSLMEYIPEGNKSDLLKASSGFSISPFPGFGT